MYSFPLQVSLHTLDTLFIRTSIKIMENMWNIIALTAESRT